MGAIIMENQRKGELLKSATCLISAGREFSIEMGSVADLKIRNLEIVNINTNHIDFIKILIPAHVN
jgi:hypothetical protein